MKAQLVFSILHFCFVKVGSTTANLVARNLQVRDYYVLHLKSDTEAIDVVPELELNYEGPLGEIPDHYIFSSTKSDEDMVKRAIKDTQRKRGARRDILDSILFSQKQRLHDPPMIRKVPPAPAGFHPLRHNTDAPSNDALTRQRSIMSQLEIIDPVFRDQWHLFNPIQLGHDVNVSDVWISGVTGLNTTVAIVDDGLDLYNKDLKPNYYAQGSYDFNDAKSDPFPTREDNHGTRCAGEVAAAKNELCGLGVAYNARISGIRILSGKISDVEEATALNFDYQNNDIYSCSWGPPDDGKSMEAPGILVQRALLNGVQRGRSSLGSIFVFAAGNGAEFEDNCNFDGYTNSIFSITVGAISRTGEHSIYSENCSGLLVVTYSSGSGDTIRTTDIGENGCYSRFGGTSAAAPLAAGIFALVLEARPDLTWRDMQYIAMKSAVPFGLEGDWQMTSTGKPFSHAFGYGKIDTFQLVKMAKSWEKVKPQSWFLSPWIHIGQDIPENGKSLSSSFHVSAETLKTANLEAVEHVTITMNVKHSKRGDLLVDLISPDNIVSHIATVRKRDNSSEGYNNWTFMSVAHWGERGVGTWTIIIRDTMENLEVGTLVSWHLSLWGVASDASKAEFLSMPTEGGYYQHNKLLKITQTAITTMLPSPTKSHTALINTDTSYPQRPTKLGHTITVTTSQTHVVSSVKPGHESVPSNKSQSIWIYSIVGALLFLSCGFIAAWAVTRRRSGSKARGDDYKFEPLNNDDPEDCDTELKDTGMT